MNWWEYGWRIYIDNPIILIILSPLMLLAYIALEYLDKYNERLPKIFKVKNKDSRVYYRDKNSQTPDRQFCKTCNNTGNKNDNKKTADNNSYIFIPLFSRFGFQFVHIVDIIRRLATKCKQNPL